MFQKCNTKTDYQLLTSLDIDEEVGADNAGHCVPKECLKQPPRSW